MVQQDLCNELLVFMVKYLVHVDSSVEDPDRIRILCGWSLDQDSGSRSKQKKVAKNYELVETS
jgi:hypothetical protein